MECLQIVKDKYEEHKRPVQLALSFVFGILFIVIILAISGVFKSSHCPWCPESFYYQFTLNSPQAVCKLDNMDNKKKCIADLPKNLTIHGVWPQLMTKKTFINNCYLDNNDTLVISQLNKSTVAELGKRWPTAFATNPDGKPANNEDFWKYEWEKHGTCSPLKAKEYFEKALVLDAKYPVNKWLADYRIVPNNAVSYTEENFRHVLNKYIYGYQYMLSCRNITLGQSNFQWLHEVKLCVSYKDMQTLISCPFPSPTPCVGRFFFVENNAGAFVDNPFKSSSHSRHINFSVLVISLISIISFFYFH